MGEYGAYFTRAYLKKKSFFAAMSTSRGKSVTDFVHPFLHHKPHLKQGSLKSLPGCLKVVPRVFQGYLNGVLGCFKDISSFFPIEFQERFFVRMFYNVLRLLSQGCVNYVPRVSQIHTAIITVNPT